MEQKYFYKSAIIDDKKITAQALMLLDAKTKNHKFFLAVDNVYPNCKPGCKKYTSFTDINSYLEYEKTIHKDNLSMYEMLTDEVVEIYDIDGTYTKSSFLNDDGSRICYDRIVEDFIDARLDFQEQFYNSIPLSRNNFLIKKTDDPDKADTPDEKISLHIIIRNDMKFKDVTELKKFTQKFYKYASQFYPKLIFDKSIYTINRNIRNLGHCKGYIKEGQTKRYSYRYPNFSSYNDKASCRRFFASYIIGGENYYEEIKDDEEFISDSDSIIYKCNSGIVDRLVDLILESITEKKLSICDTEIPDKLNYGDWQKLVFTVFNCIQDELPKTIKNMFEKLFPYYRHSSDLNFENTWNHMSNDIGTYEKLTIRSLHYFARQNPKYKDVFPDELKAHTESIALVLYKNFIKKANKTLEANLYPIKYIHEFTKLVQLSGNNIYSLEYIQNIINAICCNICNGGKNAIYAYTKDYDKSSQKETSTYTINKYNTLNATGGFLNICVRLINPEFEEQYKEFKQQQNDIVTGLKINKKELLECPKLFCYRMMTEDKIYQKSIISTMFTDNLFKTYRKAVFEPYLIEQKANKDCLNLFTGFPHKNVLNSVVTSALYENSLIFKNFKDKLCNGVKEPSSFEYVDNYIAHMIQKPSERPDSMIILSGKQGTGKDLFISFIESMIGQENVVHIDKMESLLKNFNSSIAKKLLTKVNEISDKGIHIDKHDQLKEKITCKYLTIEPKGFDSYQLDHVSRYIGFTNKETILTVEESDRRFMMIKTENDMANNIPYHTEIKTEMDSIEIIKSAFYYYATKDISKYSTRIIPTTKYKNDEKINSLPYSLKFLYYLYDNTLTDSSEKYVKHAEDIYADFLSWNIKMGNTKNTLRINMVKDFERLGLEKKRIKINNVIKEGFKISYNELEKCFQKYLNDSAFILPKN